jgi:hypothetical protein
MPRLACAAEGVAPPSPAPCPRALTQLLHGLGPVVGLRHGAPARCVFPQPRTQALHQFVQALARAVVLRQEAAACAGSQGALSVQAQAQVAGRRGQAHARELLAHQPAQVGHVLRGLRRAHLSADSWGGSGHAIQAACRSSVHCNCSASAPRSRARSQACSCEQQALRTLTSARAQWLAKRRQLHIHVKHLRQGQPDAGFGGPLRHRPCPAPPADRAPKRRATPAARQRAQLAPGGGNQCAPACPARASAAVSVDSGSPCGHGWAGTASPWRCSRRKRDCYQICSGSCIFRRGLEA